MSKPTESDGTEIALSILNNSVHINKPIHELTDMEREVLRQSLAHRVVMQRRSQQEGRNKVQHGIIVQVPGGRVTCPTCVAINQPLCEPATRGLAKPMNEFLSFQAISFRVGQELDLPFARGLGYYKVKLQKQSYEAIFGPASGSGTMLLVEDKEGYANWPENTLLLDYGESIMSAISSIELNLTMGTFADKYSELMDRKFIPCAGAYCVRNESFRYFDALAMRYGREAVGLFYIWNFIKFNSCPKCLSSRPNFEDDAPEGIRYTPADERAAFPVYTQGRLRGRASGMHTITDPENWSSF